MIGDEWDNKDDKLRFYITTRRLIKFSSNFKLVLQTDGIYKLTWFKNLILIVGSYDFNRVFHPIGLACCSREAQYECFMKISSYHIFFKFCFNCAFGYWKIIIDQNSDETNWKKSTCTCPIYFKQYICKHIIGMLYACISFLE